MSHQPYETWLFDETELSREQAQALQAHLHECQQCRGLEKSWKTLDGKIQATPMVSPQPGFSQRWRASLAERRARQQMLQVTLYRLFGRLLDHLAAAGGCVFSNCITGELIGSCF
jgi:hypothetical protein